MIIKTDWENGAEFDVFNDYNRIKNNINEIYQIAIDVFDEFKIIDINDKNRSTVLQPHVFTNIEDNLKTIADNINLDIELPDKTFEENTLVWDADDLNRIEKNIELIRECLISQNKKYRYSGTFYCGEDWGLDSIDQDVKKSKILKEDGNSILKENDKYLLKEK